MSSPVGSLPTNELIDPNTVIGSTGTDPMWMTFGKARFTTGWQTFMSGVANVLTAITSSGKTSERPTKSLYVGRTYFDTDLGFRIDYNGTVWVNSSGTPV